MAVREFDGTDDNVVVDVGAASDFQYGTVAALFRPQDVANFSSLLVFDDSGGFEQLQISIDGSSAFWWIDSGSLQNSETTTLSFSDDQWYLLVVRKEDGQVLPRWSVYDYNGDSWTHESSSSVANATAPGSGGSVRFDYAGTEFFDGRIAARAVWSNSLPFTADTSGDSAIEAAGLETHLSHWAAAGPDALWAFNQDATTTDVVDLMGNGADQTSITGTTVITDDDPPGFDFSLSTGTAVGLVAETDTAQPIGTAKAKTLDQPPETDLAQPVTTAKTYALGQATSSETAQPITARKTYTVGQATETDVALGVTTAAATAVGLATETDQALPVTVLKTHTLGLAVETDTALALVTGEPTPPIVLPPYRESAVPDYQEAAVPAYRERSVPAYQESAT